MTNTTMQRRNSTAQPKQQNTPAQLKFRRRPYAEQTRVVRIPESLLPRIQKMLLECRADVTDAAWLNK